MKKLILDHPFTPPHLSNINQSLADHLSGEAPDEAILLELVKNRDAIIQAFLIDTPKEDLKNFVEAEIKVNGLLVAYSEKLSEASLKRLSGFVRGRKAVKKYV